MSIPDFAQVLIAGGGPCGLMLANELGRRGVSVLLVDEKGSTAFNPQANATQARTMEHYRRLGFAREIRSEGLPGEYPTDIAYFTRYAGYELARFKLPSAREAGDVVKTLSGSWSAAELPHRVSQKFVETVLRRQAEALPGVSVNYGWRLVSFSQYDDGVATAIERVATGERREVRGAYLVGADGPRSKTREALGFSLGGETGVVRDFMGGRMCAVYLRAPDFYKVVPHPAAWMYVTFNQDRRTFMAAVDGKGEFAFHTQLRAGEDEEAITDDMAKRMFWRAAGAEMPIEILARGTWTAGHALVSSGFQKGRVFIGGDAAHLFTPAGGLGYNTAIEDAVNLGWKLAAVLKGRGGQQLLDSYEAERQPLARRNTSYARGFADSLGLYAAPDVIEDASPEGERARADASVYFNAHARREFNIPGVTFGGRYDGSPIIVADGTQPPPDSANEYTPTACPGGRPPHAWLDDGRSLYDLFGFEWTLLQLDPAVDPAPFAKAAQALGLDLKIVPLDVAALRDLYEAPLALIRPDQIVAWRGGDAGAAAQVLSQAAGFGRD
jgi:2-polyprenyl-6-methoxyphenol hydroxylase-like FAD-dependent oxidoreductase